MRLSIIIPAYNVEKYINYCLTSLYHQDINEKDYEVLIINDGSTDNTLVIANEFAKKHNNILVFSQSNSGVGAARNKGLTMAKGQYVYFIDPDDYLAKNVLGYILKILQEQHLDILAFNTKATDLYSLTESNANTTKIDDIKICTGIEYIEKNKYKNEIWWYVINRKFLIKSGTYFIEGRWMEDAIFTASLFLKAQYVAHIQLDVYRHVRVPNSAMTNTESSHYKKVIYDNANAATVYYNLMNSIKPNQEFKKAIMRLKVRQESFVFFLIARSLKSSLTYNQLSKILDEMKLVNAYPLKNFTTIDYSEFKYKLITLIFNSKVLLLILFQYHQK